MGWRDPCICDEIALLTLKAKKKEKAKDGNDTGKGDFAARAQSAVDSRENKGDPPDNNSSKASQGQQGGQGQGQGQGGADQAGSA